MNNTGKRVRRAVAALALAAAALAARHAAGQGLGGAFDYDIDAFRRTDPALRRYTEAAPLRPGLERLAGLAVAPGDRLCVAGGTTLLLYPAPPATNAPARAALDGAARCVAAGPDGTVYVGFDDHVEVFDAAGEQQNVWTALGEKSVITSLAVVGRHIAAADAGQRAVWLFTDRGRLVRRIGDRDPVTGTDGFIIPSAHFDVLAESAASFWAVNPGLQRVELFDLDGRVLRAWGGAGMAMNRFSGCCNPTDIARLPDGAFVTSEKGLPRVKVIEADGTLRGVVAGTEDFDEDADGLDLAADRAGRVYVLDRARGLVRIFVPLQKGGPVDAP